MVIETKHDLKESVWVLHDNKAINRTIAFIEWDNVNGINYRLHIKDREDSEDFIFKESEVFKTKEELLQSL